MNAEENRNSFDKECEYSLPIPDSHILCGAYSKSHRPDGLHWANYPCCEDQNCPLKHPELLNGATLGDELPLMDLSGIRHMLRGFYTAATRSRIAVAVAKYKACSNPDMNIIMADKRKGPYYHVGFTELGKAKRKMIKMLRDINLEVEVFTDNIYVASNDATFSAFSLDYDVPTNGTICVTVNTYDISKKESILSNWREQNINAIDTDTLPLPHMGYFGTVEGFEGWTDLLFVKCVTISNMEE